VPRIVRFDKQQLVACYERLRDEAVASCTHQQIGQQVFRQRGLVSWLSDFCTFNKPLKRQLERQHDLSSLPTTSYTQEELTSTVASMVYQLATQGANT